ncbi:MAG: hypothetical protein ACI3ZR_03450 [bacterium]
MIKYCACGKPAEVSGYCKICSNLRAQYETKKQRIKALEKELKKLEREKIALLDRLNTRANRQMDFLGGGR